MGGFDLADNYREARLPTGPDTLRNRQEPFEKLRKAINPQMALDLTRLYFDLRVPGGTDWFRDAFGETDSSFSLIDNARETAVLATGLLEVAVADGKDYAALAVLTTGASGLRRPLVRPDLIHAMQLAIRDKAVSARQQASVDPKLIVAAIEQGSEEPGKVAETLANQVFSVVQPLAAQVLTLREEVEMLWWHVGGWSRLLDKPFAKLKLGLAAVLVGVDMADMSRSAIGPAAAPAILQRTLTAGRRAKAATILIKDAVDALPQECFNRLALDDRLNTVPEICPVLAAFSKAKNIGGGPAWHAAFATATGLEAGSAFVPINIAVQAYRERLLLRALV